MKLSLLTTRAILLHRQPFSETSLIITWVSPEAGVLKTMAKGVLRPRHPYGSALDLFYLCEIRCQPSASSDLGTLREARLLDGFLPLRRDWRVVQCAHYFAELLLHLTEPRAEMVELFELYEKALRYLETHLPTARLVERYEKKLLELSGLPTDIPQALARGLAAHHHDVPALREKVVRNF